MNRTNIIFPPSRTKVFWVTLLLKSNFTDGIETINQSNSHIYNHLGFILPSSTQDVTLMSNLALSYFARFSMQCINAKFYIFFTLKFYKSNIEASAWILVVTPEMQYNLLHSSLLRWNNSCKHFCSVSCRMLHFITVLISLINHFGLYHGTVILPLVNASSESKSPCP